MLLSVSMASIPCPSRHYISPMRDLQPPLPSPTVAPSLQYFNIRVTERLRRYRLLKRQWNEVASNAQLDASFSSKPDTPLPMPDITPLTHEQLIKDYIASTSGKDKNSLESDPLNSQIQKDLMQLRKLIKARQKKSTENHSSKTNVHHRPSGDTTTTDDQEKNSTRKSSTFQRTNTLNHVKISGCQMRPATFPESTSPTVNTRQLSNMYPQQPKQANIQHIFNIYRTRVQQQSLPSDALIQGVPPPKKKIDMAPRVTSNNHGKQTPSNRSPSSSTIKKRQSTFIKSETSLPLIRQSSTTEPTTTHRYTYAASTSSASPQSMKLNRKTSLLPILLNSSSCVGLQSRRSHSGKSRENTDLLDYKHLVSHLPKPVVPIVPGYNQGDYGILFEQLDHIRERMPNCDVYENYTRIC